MSDSLRYHGLPRQALSNFQARIHTGVGCHLLLQGIFPTQGSNLVSCIAGRFFYCWEAPLTLFACLGFPGWSAVKKLPAIQETTFNVGDTGSIPRSERYPWEGNGSPLQYSYLGNPMDRGAWKTLVHGVTKIWTQLTTAQQTREKVKLF